MVQFTNTVQVTWISFESKFTFWIKKRNRNRNRRRRRRRRSSCSSRRKRFYKYQRLLQTNLICSHWRQPNNQAHRKIVIINHVIYLCFSPISFFKNPKLSEYKIEPSYNVIKCFSVFSNHKTNKHTHTHPPTHSQLKHLTSIFEWHWLEN